MRVLKVALSDDRLLVLCEVLLDSTCRRLRDVCGVCVRVNNVAGEHIIST